MTEPSPYIDVANLPAPAEGIVVTMFITVRSVARSRDFYSRETQHEPGPKPLN